MPAPSFCTTPRSTASSTSTRARRACTCRAFPETVAECIDHVVIGEALHVEDLAEHMAAQIVKHQGAVRSEVTIRAKFPITRRADRQVPLDLLDPLRRRRPPPGRRHHRAGRHPQAPGAGPGIPANQARSPAAEEARPDPTVIRSRHESGNHDLAEVLEALEASTRAGPAGRADLGPGGGRRQVGPRARLRRRDAAAEPKPPAVPPPAAPTARRGSAKSSSWSSARPSRPSSARRPTSGRSA